MSERDNSEEFRDFLNNPFEETSYDNPKRPHTRTSDQHTKDHVIFSPIPVVEAIFTNPKFLLKLHWPPLRVLPK